MKKDCLQIEELISAAIDGELEHGEFAELESHVDNCSGCRDRYRQLEAVNDLLDDFDQSLAASKAMVETSARLPVSPIPNADWQTGTTESPINSLAMTTRSATPPGSFDTANGGVATMRPPNAKPAKAAQPRKTKHTGRRLAMLAGGAFAAIGVAAMLTTDTTPTNEQRSVDSAALSQAVQQVTLLNHEAKRAQLSQTKMMTYELRALRLAAKNVKADPEKQQLIADKIDSIQRRLEQLVLSP